MHIVDQTSDAGFATLHVIVERFPEVIGMAKTANLDASEFNDLPDNAFAWPGLRKFPIHTAEHAALSYGYSKLAAALPADVQENLEKAASVYGINTESFNQPVVLEKVASNAQYLLPEKSRFLVRDAQDIPEVERVYHEKYASLAIAERAEAGFRLVKIAQQYQVSLKPETEKLAGFTITSTRILRDWIGARQAAATKLGSDLASVYEMIDNSFKGAEAAIYDREYQVKLAQLISDLDKKANLTPFYGKSLPDPIQTVFNTTKLARDYVKVGNVLQNKALLASLPLSFWQDTLGADVAAEIAPNGTVDPEILEQILPTLPEDLKNTLERQLAAYQ